MSWAPGWALWLQRLRSQGWADSLTVHRGSMSGPWEDVSAYKQFPQGLSLLPSPQPVMMSIYEQFSKWVAEF